MPIEQLPDKLRCQVGSVAIIERGNPRNIGRIVVVTKEHGFRTYASLGSQPHFCWTVESLGEKVWAGDEAEWSGVTPDESLRPITTIGAESIRSIVLEHSTHKFRAALADLAKVMEAHYAEPDDAGLTGAKRMEREQLNWLLTRVPARQALTEAWFVPDENGSDGLEFSADVSGRTVKFSACADFVDNWRVFAVTSTARTVMHAEVLITAETLRGDVYARLASVWRQAFGKSVPLPDDWQHATAYEDLKRTRAVTNPGLPQVRADAKFLRMIVDRLRDNFDPSTPTEVVISAMSGQLELRVGREAFHCPAQGNWLGQATVDLAELIEAVPRRMRRRSVCIEMIGEDLVIEGSRMPAAWSI